MVENIKEKIKDDDGNIALAKIKYYNNVLKNPKLSDEQIKQIENEHKENEIKSIVERIAGNQNLNLQVVKQDIHLADNQNKKIKCGDNGIFRGVPLSEEEKKLSKIARDIYNKYPSDGKYILDNDKLIICQSNASTKD